MTATPLNLTKVKGCKKVRHVRSCSEGGVFAGAPDYYIVGLTIVFCYKPCRLCRDLTLPTSLQTHKNRFLPPCHVHSAELFSSPKDDDPLLEHFFSTKTGRDSNGFISDPLHTHSFRTLSCQDTQSQSLFLQRKEPGNCSG